MKVPFYLKMLAGILSIPIVYGIIVSVLSGVFCLITDMGFKDIAVSIPIILASIIGTLLYAVSLLIEEG